MNPLPKTQEQLQNPKRINRVYIPHPVIWTGTGKLNSCQTPRHGYRRNSEKGLLSRYKIG
jgi:hypothetical protein